VAALALQAAGARLVAASDRAGGVYDERGLDPAALLRAAKEHGSVVGFRGGQRLSNAQLLTCPCDILIPAAVQNQLTAANAGQVQAKLVVEGANGPTTPGADRVLRERGVLVVPDILANAGGVTVSYFEWVQDLQSFFWSEAEINAKLFAIMERAFDSVLRRSLDEGVDLRTAAYMQAVTKVTEGYLLRGIYP
jgi:glutamate dehydrogenase (NAD(P)+)